MLPEKSATAARALPMCIQTGVRTGAIDVGPLRIEDPVVLAPMSGVTDLPFRRLVKACGAGLVVSEMVASRELLRESRQSLRMIETTADEAPRAVQLAGCEPDVMADAARFNEDRGAAIIDINFGCPVKKVVGGQAGSALMRDEALAGRILEATARAVGVPVTLKMRLGWDDGSRNCARIARIAREAGIRMITVHGRTRQQMYDGSADWAAVRRVREAVDLPLLVNGDIVSVDAARRALELSGADGVMIGRGACGRPWFPGQVAAALRGDPVPADPPMAVRREMVLRHYDETLSHYGVAQGVRIARKHLGWYAAGLPGGEAFRAAANRSDDPAAVVRLIRDAFASGPDRLAA
jgi:tRNA-dihydrouridine synthase B